ncbi:MAG: hypothetical protein KGR46_08355 [Verrucomicrobia bacterium]|nr:hypothetical protein [Verrucomicrobiota bacterium]
MSPAARGGLRQGVAVALAGLAIGAFHVPQPFLCVLAEQLTAGFAPTRPAEFGWRLVAAAAGSLGAMAVLVLAPNEQWISLPLFFAHAGFGTVWFFRKHGAACGTLFVMGSASMFAEAFIFPQRDLGFGLAHLVSLVVATTVVFPVGRFFLGWSDGGAKHHGGAADAIQVGATGVSALVLACVFLPEQPTVTTVASVATALALLGNTGGIGERFAGGVLGIGVSLAFLIVFTGSGNDVGLYLLGLGVLAGCFEWAAERRPSWAAGFRQGAAMFVVGSTIFPRPDLHLTLTFERAAAIFIGLAVGCAIAVARQEMARLDVGLGRRRTSV